MAGFPQDTDASLSRLERMRRALDTAFQPSVLALEDISAAHAGHAGARPGGETHYHLVMRAACFQGCSRVVAQRRVLEALKPEFASGLHALSMEVGE